MAKKKSEALSTESVTLAVPTLIGGTWHEAGDEVEVAPFQRRHLIHYGGYAEGNRFGDEVFSEGEKEQNAPEVLKRASDREDMEVWSIERAFEEGAGYGDTSEGQDSEEPGAGNSSSA